MPPVPRPNAGTLAAAGTVPFPLVVAIAVQRTSLAWCTFNDHALQFNGPLGLTFHVPDCNCWDVQDFSPQRLQCWKTSPRNCNAGD